MTAVAERAAVPTGRTLWTLAGMESRRYARYPLFLVGAVLLTWVTILGASGTDAAAGEATIEPAFFLGLLGVLVGHQLTRSTSGAAEAVDASPADGVMRTAALCMGCLLPGAVAVVWVVGAYLSTSMWAVPGSTAITPVDRAAMLLASVLYAVGGPLVGVMVGRWTTFPGAGLLAAVVLAAWTVLGTFGLQMTASHTSTLVHLNPPYTSWVSADGPRQPRWVAGGSPVWYLVYLTLLCGLAAAAALLHEARGAQRSRLVRVLLTLGVLAMGSLGMAAAADPSRIPL